MSTQTEKDYTETLWCWGRNDPTPKFNCITLRIADINRSLRFYVEGLGMRLLDRIDLPPRNAKLLMLGFESGSYESGGLLELVRYLDDDGPYSAGSGFIHISLSIPDVRAAVERLESVGAEITVPPTEYFDGKGPWMSHVNDPDGYGIALLQTTPSDSAA